MYLSAVRETPMEKMVTDIRNREHFTEYEDLPSIYIDAVISVEDKWKHRRKSCAGFWLMKLRPRWMKEIGNINPRMY